MKALIATIMLGVSSLVMHAQHDVTKFLGIPVDGTKSEMIKKLETKGFILNSDAKKYWGEDVLEGEFNGSDVYVHIVTNNNKVYRIMVVDKRSVGESSIKIRFNGLCEQFENNKKYIPYEKTQTLSYDEDISYEILVHKKRYQAAFYQCPDDLINSSQAYKQIMCPTENLVWFMITEESGEYKIALFYDNTHNQANGEDL